MINGILDASRGCLKEEIRIDIISNNLANTNVIGFKKDRVSFQELLTQTGPDGIQKNSTGDPTESALISIHTDLSEGDLRSTGNSLDFAIHGNGFFKVDTPAGIRYTRKGNFRLDAQGTLITQEGFRIMGKSGSIGIYGNEINVDREGYVSVDGAEIGQLDVVDFENHQDLVKEGGGLFRNGVDNPEITPPPDTTIKQGYVELSNVNVAEEMVQMIQSLRAFESYQKAIKVFDGMNSKRIKSYSY